ITVLVQLQPLTNMMRGGGLRPEDVAKESLGEHGADPPPDRVRRQVDLDLHPRAQPGERWRGPAGPGRPRRELPRRARPPPRALHRALPQPRPEDERRRPLDARPPAAPAPAEPDPARARGRSARVPRAECRALRPVREP